MSSAISVSYIDELCVCSFVTLMVPFVSLSRAKEGHTILSFQSFKERLLLLVRRSVVPAQLAGLCYSLSLFPPKRATKVTTYFLVAKVSEKFIFSTLSTKPLPVEAGCKGKQLLSDFATRTEKSFSTFLRFQPARPLSVSSGVQR